MQPCWDELTTREKPLWGDTNDWPAKQTNPNELNMQAAWN